MTNRFSVSMWLPAGPAASALVLAAALLSFKLPRARAIPLTVKLEAAES